MSALLPLDVALAAVLDGLAPVAARRVAPEEATGAALAEAVVAPGPVPAHAAALRAGLAVAALDLVGASAATPAVLARRPAGVVAGQALPEGCDAVLAPEAASGEGPCEIAEGVAPGEGAALPGSDAGAGAILAGPGARVGARLVLACRLAGIDALAIRRPRVAIEACADPAADWLAAMLARAGTERVEAPAEADLTILWDATAAPSLALAPGGATRLTRAGARVEARLAPRFDSAFGALAGALWPALARLSGRRLAPETRPLAAKLVSAIGFSELALLDATPAGAWRPLAVGAAPLSALLAAQAVALVDPACEGLPAGAPLAAIWLDRPFAGAGGA